MKLIAASVVLAITLTGCGAPRQPTESEKYQDRCHELGGFVSKRSESWNAIYNCVGQTAGPPLPELVRS